MSFDFTTLITDRTPGDVQRVRDVAAKIINGTASEAEIAEWNAATMKGAYNYADLNRVTAAIEALKSTLEGYGHIVPGYKRIEIPHKGSGGGSRLPAGHTELKWIESTGTQVIDSGVVGSNTIGFECEFETVTPVASSGQGTIFGCLNSTSARYEITTWTNSSAKGQFCFGAKQYDPGITVNKPIALSLRSGIFTTPSGSVSVATTAFNSGANIALFGRYRSGYGFDEFSKTRIPYFRLYDGDTLVRDYVPDMTDDGQVGLYDLVEGKFYPNAGTGVFLAGPRRVQLPDGYTQVEYIESTGTQHIDTKFKPNQDTRAVLDFQYTDTSETTWIFGVQPAWANAMFDVAVYSDGVRMHSGYGTKSVAITDIVGTSRIHVDKNKNVTTVNGVAYSAAANTFQSQLSALIFADNTNDGVAYHAKAKTFFGQIYDNGELFSDYIPVINSSGEGGLYDLLTGEFCGNAGTGSFIVGPVVEWDFLPDVDDTEKDPYLWYESDIPTPALMTDYLANVSVIRSALDVFPTTPAVPADMERLTVEKANAIERILVDISGLILNMVAAWFYSGEVYSGEV